LISAEKISIINKLKTENKKLKWIMNKNEPFLTVINFFERLKQKINRKRFIFIF